MIIANREKLQQAQLISLKLSLLKQSVYPKKRTISQRSQSLKAIIPKRETMREKIFNSEQKILQEEKSTQQPLSGRSLNSLKMTTLQFKSRRSLSNNIVPWTVQNWLPRTSGATQKSSSRPRIKQQDKEKQFLKRVVCEAPPQLNKKVERRYQQKDGQSLLRKNSLFLVSFIKSKQKKNSKIAHVGNVPLILDKLESNKIPFERRQREEQRQKKAVRYVKMWRQDYGYQKQEESEVHTNLYPQPW